MMKEKLMKLLMPWVGYAAQAAAEDLISKGVTVQDETDKWISVEERLPQVGQRVLVYCSSRQLAKHVTCCTYYNGYLGSRIWSRRVRNVTHWMPMPEPPKGE